MGRLTILGAARVLDGTGRDPLRDLRRFQSPENLRLIMKQGAIVTSRLG